MDERIGDTGVTGDEAGERESDEDDETEDDSEGGLEQCW